MPLVRDSYPKAQPRLGAWAAGHKSLADRPREKDEAHLQARALEPQSQAVSKFAVNPGNKPTPPAPPTPPGEPISGPSANFIGKLTGAGLSVIGSLLGATGAVLLSHAIGWGPVPLAETIGQQGVLQSFNMFAQIDLSTALLAGLSACSACLGGSVVETKLAELFSRRPGTSAAAEGSAQPRNPLTCKILGGVTTLCTLPATATGGFLGGHLLAQAVSASAPVALGTAVAGAALMGGLSLVGGWKIGQEVFG